MSDARVLVVDDSAAMRALFADILEQTKGVTVVHVAGLRLQLGRSPTDRLRKSIRVLPWLHICDLCFPPISRAFDGAFGAT